jgi:uncharacterized membrane protein/nitrite reductase/ring-hydroxylating ferredoxin subunit
MKSRAHIKSHPLHPILVSFPIAFFFGTLVFDVLGFANENDRFTSTALYLNVAGVVMAVIAAIPGLIDYLYTVPPKSSAKKRATKHALLNVGMLGLFSIALAYRLNEDTPSPAILLSLEGLGVTMMTFAGWMGGTLVHRNQIGIDPRYAFAGKWKEEFPAEKTGRVPVGKADDLKRDQMKLIHVGEKRIVVGRTEDGFVAFDDRCTHKGGSLAGGMMICGTVQCPWHGTQFDVRTGSVKAGPGSERIPTYKIDVANGMLFLDIRG